MTTVCVIGDALLDRDWEGRPAALCPDSWAPVIDLDDELVRPGGAALAALAARSLGGDVVFVTALGRDAAGARLTALLDQAGVRVVDLGLEGSTPEKIRVRSGHGTVVRLDRSCRARPASGPWTRAASDALRMADGVLLSDYGRSLVHRPEIAEHVDGRDVPVVWDPHRSSARPSGRVDLVTPSVSEAQELVERRDPDHELAVRAAQAWSTTVALTRGADPVLVATPEGAVTAIPGSPVDGDPCGAGDHFAAATTASLACGGEVVGAVGAGCDAARRWIGRDAADLARPPRVVATSGCFDVLHVGHLELLRHARSLGDRLVVLLNSDESVRRLKGHGRPVNGEGDRRALLAALDAVDDVVVFDELTPCRALEALGPDVFVKGADYEGVDLPEAEVMRRCGGTVAFAPLVPGRSTTRTLDLVARLTG